MPPVASLLSQLTPTDPSNSQEIRGKSLKLLYVALGLRFEDCTIPAAGFTPGIWERNKAGKYRVRSVVLKLFDNMCSLLCPGDEAGIKEFFFDVVGRQMYGSMHLPSAGNEVGLGTLEN